MTETPEPQAERLAINTNTPGIEIGIYPSRFANRMFANVAALGLLGRYDRATGGTLPVTVGGVVGTAGAADANVWGSGINETGEGAARARVDPGFEDSVKFESHDATWAVDASFEQVRDMTGFEEWLEERAGYMLAQHLLWRAVDGSGSGQGVGALTALAGDGSNVSGAGPTPTVAELRSMRFELVAAAYRAHPSCAWWCGDAMLDDLSGLADGGERLLKFDRVPPGAEATLYGKPVYAVPGFGHGASVAGTLAFGAWECMGVSLVDDLRARRGDEVPGAWEADMWAFDFHQSYDTQLIDKAGLVLFDSGA